MNVRVSSSLLSESRYAPLGASVHRRARGWELRHLALACFFYGVPKSRIPGWFNTRRDIWWRS